MRQVVALKTKLASTWKEESIAASELSLADKRWYVRLLWWVAVKLGLSFSHGKHYDCFHTVPINSQSILERIELSENEIRRIYHGEIKFLLIGNKLAHELMGEVASRSYFECPISGYFGIDGHTKILGMTMVVVPWMDGFCLVPDLKEKSQPYSRNGYAGSQS